MAKPIAVTTQSHSVSSLLPASTVFDVELPSTSITPLEEEEWIGRAIRGDIAAFDWLIQRYRARATRLASQVLRRPSDADDVVQETFLRAFSQIGNFRGDCSFYTWIYRILLRVCLNHMRTPFWKRRSKGDFLEWTDNISVHTAAPSDTKLLVDELMKKLSPPLRAALYLREIEGLEYEEIAQVLQIPVGTVRSRLNAARQQFQKRWNQIQQETQDV